MSKISFQVAARTARLIGRENIASARGAVIELVKNAYDADSRFCIVLVDNRYKSLPETIGHKEWDFLLKQNVPRILLDASYQRTDDFYSLKKERDAAKSVKLAEALDVFNAIYIIDGGEGMTQQIIRDHWMTIGTDNKAIDMFTKSNKVKSGAKGIGRFALDKLGDICEMVTVFDKSAHKPDRDVNGHKTSFDGYVWEVDWRDFEGDFKTLDKVKAELNGIKTKTFKEEVLKKVDERNVLSLIESLDLKSGTILKITNLRDAWTKEESEALFNDMEVLIPPKGTGHFAVHFFDYSQPDKFGEVTGSLCDDFDYKLVAKSDGDKKVKITVYRSEYDVKLIPPDFFDRPAMAKHPYTKEDFFRGKWSQTYSFANLMPGFEKIDKSDLLSQIGQFEFTFYYLKRTYNSVDAKRFFTQTFTPSIRKRWLDSFGGIKLFRDNFRVRPYGEVRDIAFDWLGLGNRKATSPAGVAKRDGGYKVEPENVAGAVSITRLANFNFEDKSSREGLQDNPVFSVFKTLIASIIGVFEVDRSYIAREMADYDYVKNAGVKNWKDAEEIAKRILSHSRTSMANDTSGNSTVNEEAPPYGDDPQLLVLAKLNEKKTVEIEKLIHEQNLLRALASSGIVMASFSHDLSKLNDVLKTRADKLQELISSKINRSEYSRVEDRKNPFIQLERIKAQDQKLRNWLNFSLGATRKDKRRRKDLPLKKYFNDYKEDWKEVLEVRAVEFDVSRVADISLRIFEIDFDSVFNNLLVNSLEAFNSSTISRPRKISIEIFEQGREITVNYSDNGPGLSPDLLQPQDIFEPLFTTKKNTITGEDYGTGLGMWIIKSIVSENDGDVKLLFPSEGFGLRFIFPVKFKLTKNV